MEKWLEIVLLSSLLSAIVSSIISLLSNVSQRKSEEKRLILEVATKLVELKDKQVNEAVNRMHKSGQPYTAKWVDPGDTIKNYFKEVEKIWRK